MPLPELNILGANKASDVSTKAALRPYGYTRKSSGTANLGLTVALSTKTGFWDAPAQVSSKPPRWILHLTESGGALGAGLAEDATGAVLPGAGTPGYINNGEGNCAVVAFRIMPALQRGNQSFVFPPDWEWIVQFVFATPLPPGTSGETLAEFNVADSSLTYSGRGNPPTAYPAARIDLVRTLNPSPAPVTVPSSVTYTYDDATDAIKSWLDGGTASGAVYDPAVPAEMADLTTDIRDAVQPTRDPSASTLVQASPELFDVPTETYELINAALAAGKRNFIFHGPPGTGKTTLAQYVAEQIISNLDPDGDLNYTLLTASSSWSSQDLVGGYQPIGHGEIAFIPGPLLREFDRPMIIDELNRAPIDKVLGPLFSVLSGQPTTLPYRTDVADRDSVNYRILPVPGTSLAPHEFAPGPAWSLICTMNEMDKSQLEPLSFALARRFVWVRIGVPEDIPGFITKALAVRGLGDEDGAATSNPVAELWLLVNKLRELGAAPFLDFLDLAKTMNPAIDFQAPLTPDGIDTFIQVAGATLIPLLDGIAKSDGERLADELANVWSVSDSQRIDLLKRILDVAL